MSQHKIRLWLSSCGVFVTSSLLAFLWFISLNMNYETKSVLEMLLILMGICAVLAQSIYFFKGDIFYRSGKLKKTEIITNTAGILIILQITFLFANYSFQQVNFSQTGLVEAKKVFLAVQSQLENNSFKDDFDVFSEKSQENLLADRPELLRIIAVDRSDRIVYKLAGFDAGQYYKANQLDYYKFPISDGAIIVELNKDYNRQILLRFVVELLTIMIVSVFLTIELLLFGIKIIENKAFKPILINGEKPNQALAFVRQISFLFYFATGLVTSFIPVLAKSLGGSLFGLNGNTLASLPQSAEIFTTCVAILFSGVLLEKKGWKVPFVLGLVFVVVGSIASAWASNILLFILARIITGFGYGFCWMTLRNFALFGRTEEEKGIGFSLLNAGLYAGLNCGAVLGGVLAERFGFQITIFISALFTLSCFLLVIGFSNSKYKRPKLLNNSVHDKVNIYGYEWFIVALFTLLIVLPSCIINAFPTFYLPIYLTSIGYTTADVGRMQLLYGLVIVYAGPVIVKKILKTTKLLTWNIISNILFSVALILFGIQGDFCSAMIAIAIIGFADSFGFVVQNNYFLGLKPMLKIGESQALTYISLLKKFYQMLGPVVLALFLSNSDVSSLIIMGGLFIVIAISFGFIAKKYQNIIE